MRQINLVMDGSHNSELIGELLETGGLQIARIPTVRSFLDKPRFLFDVLRRDYFYLTYATTLRAFLKYGRGKHIICHVVGSDALELRKSLPDLRSLLRDRPNISFLYVAENLRDELGLEGTIAPIPVKDSLFSPQGEQLLGRDTLFYCPDPWLYRADRIQSYIESHANEEITILGAPMGLFNQANVKILEKVPSASMPALYRGHKRLIRWTRHDGMPKMIFEALLCGCEVYWNDTQVTEVPSSMRWQEGAHAIANRVHESFGF